MLDKMSNKVLIAPLILIIFLFLIANFALFYMKFVEIYDTNGTSNYYKYSKSTIEFVKNYIDGANDEDSINKRLKSLDFLYLKGVVLDINGSKFETKYKFGNDLSEFDVLSEYPDAKDKLKNTNNPFFAKKILLNNKVEISYIEKIDENRAIGYEKIMPFKINTIYSKEFLEWFYTNMLFSLIAGVIFMITAVCIMLKFYFMLKKTMRLDNIEMKRINRLLEIKNRALKKELYIDNLTNMPSRYKLERDIADLKHPRIIVIDIDDFSNISDYYGDMIANRVLIEVSSAIKEFAKINGLSAYNFRLDKFVLLEDSEFDIDRYEAIANDLIDKFKGYIIRINDEYGENILIEICCSIGFCLDYKDPIKKALMALKRAKQEHKDYLCYFTYMDTTKEYIRRKRHSHIISKAIMNNQVVPYFQPIFDKDKNVIKYEALVRIVNNEDGVLLPGIFIKDSKLIKRYACITKTIIEKCFLQAKLNPNVVISVNISIGDMIDGDVSAFIIEKLSEMQVAKQIVFEVLEDENMEDPDRVKSFIDKVRRMGSKIAIDDFGSGYSNFSYILKIKPDYLKIDGSIIKRVSTQEDSYIVVSAIVAFAKKLGIKTIAEFVYNESIFKRCIEIGVDEFQGFYLGEPNDKFID